MKDELLKIFDEKLARDGLLMTKALSHGFFGSTYDNRTVYSRQDLFKLNKEGFSAGSDFGLWIFNMIASL